MSLAEDGLTRALAQRVVEGLGVPGPSAASAWLGDLSGVGPASNFFHRRLPPADGSARLEGRLAGLLGAARAGERWVPPAGGRTLTRS